MYAHHFRQVRPKLEQETEWNANSHLPIHYTQSNVVSRRTHTFTLHHTNVKAPRAAFSTVGYFLLSLQGRRIHGRQANTHTLYPPHRRLTQPTSGTPCYYGRAHAEPLRQLFLCESVSVCRCELVVCSAQCFPAAGGSDLERMRWKGRGVAAVKPAGSGRK